MCGIVLKSMCSTVCMNASYGGLTLSFDIHHNHHCQRHSVISITLADLQSVPYEMHRAHVMNSLRLWVQNSCFKRMSVHGTQRVANECK